MPAIPSSVSPAPRTLKGALTNYMNQYGLLLGWVESNWKPKRTDELERFKDLLQTQVRKGIATPQNVIDLQLRDFGDLLHNAGYDFKDTPLPVTLTQYGSGFLGAVIIQAGKALQADIIEPMQKGDFIPPGPVTLPKPNSQEQAALDLYKALSRFHADHCATLQAATRALRVIFHNGTMADMVSNIAKGAETYTKPSSDFSMFEVKSLLEATDILDAVKVMLDYAQKVQKANLPANLVGNMDHMIASYKKTVIASIMGVSKAFSGPPDNAWVEAHKILFTPAMAPYLSAISQGNGGPTP